MNSVSLFADLPCVIDTLRLPNYSTNDWETSGFDEDSLLTTIIIKDVSDYGINSSMDDCSEALQNIINNNDPNVFTKIQFPDGIFSFRNTVLLNSNMSLEGTYNIETSSGTKFIYYDRLNVDPPKQDFLKIGDDIINNPNNYIVNVIIKNLHIETISNGVPEPDISRHGYHHIRMWYAKNCLVENVESFNATGDHFTIYHSEYITVKKNYIHESKIYSHGGYGVSLTRGTYHCLVEDNIFRKLRHALILSNYADENVIAYNYCCDQYATDGNGVQGTSCSDVSLHGHADDLDYDDGPAYNLFEGNMIEWIKIDDYWNANDHYNTFLRNWARDDSRPFLIQEDTNFIRIESELQGSQNIVGCLMGFDSSTQWTIDDGFLRTYYYTTSFPYFDDRIGRNESSYYYSNQPVFMNGFDWPYTPGDDIPAKRRFDNKYLEVPYLYYHSHPGSDLFFFDYDYYQSSAEPFAEYNTGSSYEYYLMGTGNFTGNSNQEIALFRNEDNLLAFHNPFESTNLGSVHIIDNSYTLIGTGDFNQDGIDEVVLYKHNGDKMNNDLFFYEYEFYASAQEPFLTIDTGSYYEYTLIATGDFSGNGNEEIALYRDYDGLVAFFDPCASPALIKTTHLPLNDYSMMESGEFNHDNTDEIVMYKHNGDVVNNDLFFFEYKYENPAVPFKLTNTGSSYEYYLMSTGDFTGSGHQEIALFRDNAELMAFIDPLLETSLIGGIHLENDDPFTMLSSIKRPPLYPSRNIVSDDSSIDPIFSISNYPNPFNPTTSISFNLPEDSLVKLEIYNIKGQKVRTLVNDQLERGIHDVIWNGRNENNKSVASGVYFYRLNVNKKTEKVKKMLLLK